MAKHLVESETSPGTGLFATMPLLPCRVSLKSCRGWAFKPKNGHQDLILPQGNPGAGIDFKEISVKHDTRPAVKEQGETQAMGAAEINQGPQLCCCSPQEAAGEMLESSYRPVCLPTHRYGSMKLLPRESFGGSVVAQTTYTKTQPSAQPSLQGPPQKQGQAWPPLLQELHTPHSDTDLQELNSSHRTVPLGQSHKGTSGQQHRVKLADT